MQEDEQRSEEGKAMVAEEEEEKIINGSSGSVGGGGVSVVAAATVVLPPDLVAAEVLTRLPVKSLMRFKCVSKLWRSTISQDPDFSKAHRARQHSASLFITCPDADNSLRCFYSPLPPPPSKPGEEPVVVPQLHQFTIAPDSASDSPCKYNGATEVINGLFCLHAGNRAWICNVSTREIRELPFSSDLENARAFHYFFGLPSTSKKEYKLFKTCLLPKMSKTTNLFDYYHRTCEILTLGKDLLWRRPWTLLDNPQIDLVLDQTSVYINGSLCCWHRNAYTLIVFNFEDESFQMIGPPPKASGSRIDEDGSLLLQFRGHFALLRQKEELSGRVVPWLVDQKLHLWVLELNRCNKQRSYEWVKHIIDLPCDFPVRRCSFLGNLPLPTGDRMLLTGLADIANKKPDVPIYSYDDTKGKFEKFVIGKFPPWSPSSQDATICWKDTNKFRVHYFEENITPLNDLVVSNKDPSLTSSCTEKKEEEEGKKKKKGNGTTTLSKGRARIWLLATSIRVSPLVSPRRGRRRRRGRLTGQLC